MAVSVSNEYKQIIYSGDARNKLKILFNNVELEDADRYCERMTVKSRIVPNGAKIFSLNNFISKEVELILHDIDTSIIKDQISISIGTLVGNSYEYVPIGIFNIQDTPTNDKRKTTIKLRDNSVKFDFNYNAQELIEENGGSATKLQILQDICSQAGVTCNINSFIGYLDGIGVYDNTITAREYISRLAEQAGRIATINRSGELIFVDLNNLTTWEIPIEIVEKYENGTKYKIGRVVYEDGIVRYETPTSTDDTLFLDGSNNYISGELVKEQSSSSNNSYYLENTSEADLAYFELEGKTTQETRSGKNLLQTSNWINAYISSDGVIMNANNNCLFDGYIKVTPNTQYTVSSNRKLTNISISEFTNDQLFIQRTQVNSISSSTIITTTTTQYVRVAFNYDGSTTITQTIIDSLELQLEKGQKTSYEPYGVMPSPDYPSELVSVGYSNSMQNPTSRVNLNNWYFIDSPTNIQITQEMVGKYVNIAYDIDIKSLSTTGNVTSLIGYGTTATVMQNEFTNSPFPDYSLGKHHISFSTKAITANMVGKYFIMRYIRFSTTSNAVCDVSNIIINIAKKSAIVDYVPYGKYGIEVKTTGKNLCYVEDGTATSQTVAITFSDNKLKLNGTTSAAISANANIWKNIKFTAKEQGKYKILSKSAFPTGAAFGYYLENSSTLIGTGSVLQPGNYTVGIYIPANATFNNFETALQIEPGETSTDFEPYQGNTQLYVLDNPLRSIGDIKDLLYIKNGMLYVDRKIGSVVLNGSENWDKSTDDGGYPRYFTIISDAYYHDDNKRHSDKIKSNYFIATTTTSPQSIYQYRDQMLFDTPTTLNTLQLFKSWLSTHNTEVQYVLAEPYTEELGTIEVPSTYEEITYIDISSNINTNTYLQYREDKTQVEAILNEVDEFDIDSLKTGKILGNPAIDSYDLIQITDGNKIFKTLATNDLVYTGVLINTFDTQIGEEAKEQNVFINGEETFKKWARTSIDNVEGSISLQAGKIDEANDRINTTNLTIDSQGALLNVLANNSNIDVQYDSAGNPLSGEVREVTTTTGFKFNAEGMTIEDTSSNFKALHRNTGVTYYDGTTIVGQYTKDGSKQKDLELFGVYYYGKNDLPDTPMFVAQLYTDKNGEECFGHFYNRSDN